jgi:hypothetical protein
MVVTILKFLQRILSYSIKNVDKIGPLVILLQTLFWFRGKIHSIFSSWVIIRDMFNALDKLPVFRFFKNILRLLSIGSLFLNLIILALFTEISVLNWIPTIPILSQGMAFVYESTPESTQNYISWIALKIKTFILWIWNNFLDFLKRIVKAVIGELDKYPTDNPGISPIDPDKEKYGDIHSKEYFKWLFNKLDEYKYFFILSSVVIIGGVAVYLYWDSISSCWRSRPDLPDPDSSGEFPAYNPQPPIERPRSLPSVSSDSSGGLDGYFRKSIGEKLLNYKAKVRKFFKVSEAPKIANIPQGIYMENGRELYNGLPLPRVELFDGTEYYFNKDRDGFIQVVSNLFTDSGKVETINPFSNKSISTNYISVNERISLINKARGSAIYNAPENSFARNPVFDASHLDLSKPDFSTTSAASSSNLPGDNFEDIPLSPESFSESLLNNLLRKGKNKENTIPENINPEAGAFGSGSTTPTQSPKIDPFSDFID